VVVGWVGIGLLLWTAVTGYRVVDDQTAQAHLMASLFGTAALMFADLCLVVYLQGIRRMVRRTAAEMGLGGHWLADYARLARRGTWAVTLAVTAVMATFGVGFSTYTGRLDGRVHHGLAIASFLLQIVALLVGARVLRRSEEGLVAFGQEVEALRYTAPSASAGPAKP
jgi:hypothetical protein